MPGDIGPINNGRVLTIRRVEEGAVEGRAARGGLTRREGGTGGFAVGVTGGNARRTAKIAGAGRARDSSGECGAAKWAAEPLHEATVGVVGGALAGDV